MELDAAVDLIRQSLMTGLWICAPVLITSMVVGLVLGVLQAATQISEPTVNLVPRLFATVLVLVLLLPWGLQVLVDYTISVWHNSP